MICHGIPDLRPLQDGDIVNGKRYLEVISIFCASSYSSPHCFIYLIVEGIRPFLPLSLFLFAFYQNFSVDVTVYHRGFHGDLNETFFVGKVDDESKKLVRVTHECLQNAINIVRPGVKYRDIGAVIEKHARANGFSVVRTYCGHGIHRQAHIPALNKGSNRP